MAGKTWAAMSPGIKRSCIVTKRNVEATFLPQFSDNDLTAIITRVDKGNTEGTTEIDHYSIPILTMEFEGGVPGQSSRKVNRLGEQ